MIDVADLAVLQGSFEMSGLTFHVRAGEYATLMGRTGSGKSTVIELIAGLRTPDYGTIRINGVDVTHAEPGSRGVGYVPQDGALFRTMTVRRHLRFALELRNRPESEIRNRVDQLAQQLGIAHLLDRYPAGLSGGEIQRTALGRALSFAPRILLLDEPLSALDDGTRTEIIELLTTIRNTRETTVLHVTHSAAESDRLADRRLCIVDGKITEQS